MVSALFHGGLIDEAHDTPTNVDFSLPPTARGINTMADIKSLKVTELKEELKKRGLVTTGLKKDVSTSRSGAKRTCEAHNRTQTGSSTQSRVQHQCTRCRCSCESMELCTFRLAVHRRNAMLTS